MGIPSVIQDCYPGRESFEAKIECDNCGDRDRITGDGPTATEHRIRKIAETTGWSSQPDASDTRKTPGRLDYCPDCR